MLICVYLQCIIMINKKSKGFDFMQQYYKGRRIVISNGYQDVYFPEHPNSRKNGNVYVHILVAEDIIGRHLTSLEVVHHVDFNKQNNDKTNIMIFDSSSSHSVYHQCLEYKHDYVLYCINGIYHCEQVVSSNNHYRIDIHGHIRQFSVCQVCGKIITNGSKMCVDCSHVYCRVVTRPSRNELKDKIRKESFVSIGKFYGVSDNAVRKWCKYYGLPSKSSEIKAISCYDWKHL